MRSVHSVLLTSVFSATSLLPATALTASAPGAGDRAHFQIEGVKLGMTLPELTAAIKPVAPKVTHDATGTIARFKTSDLDFTVVFGKSGVLNRMDIFSISKVKGANDLSDLSHAAAHSIMYKRAVEAYGKPDDTSSGDSANWNSPSGTVASYYPQDDTVEIVAK